MYRSVRPEHIDFRGASAVLRVMAIAATLFLTACGPDAERSPMAPTSEDVTTVSAATGNQWIQRVSGGGTGHLASTGQINNGRINVRRLESGVVTGTFALNGRIPNGQNTQGLTVEFDIRAEADCLVVDGDVAWASGPITEVKKFNIPGVPAPAIGDPYLAIITDTGPSEGNGWFGPPFLVGAIDCQDMPASPPDPPGVKLNGNFQIQGR